MSVRLRIVQQYQPGREKEFMDLERKFAKLEIRRPDFPKGRRLKPISGPESPHTLIWECDFPDMKAAHAALNFFAGDPDHDALFVRQSRYMTKTRVEFYESLDF